MEYALEHYDVKKYYASRMWPILYQCAGEKFPLIILYLSALYSNETVERFFSFIKVVKSDSHGKLSEENTEALLK